MLLPELTPHTRVCASDARQDKIEYELPLGTFTDLPYIPQEGMSGISLGEVAENLGAPPVSIRALEHQELHWQFSCYFNRPTGQHPERKLTVRSEPINDLESNPLFDSVPLCSGMLILAKSWAGRDQFLAAIYRANVNPTRFLRYQDPNTVRTDYVPAGTPPLFRDTSVASSVEEMAADGNDNWLPDLDAAIWRSYLGNWNQRLREYFTEIEQAMRGEMQRRVEVSTTTGTLSFTPSSEPWTLTYVETYWEFSSETSPEMLALFERAMRSYSALSHVAQEFDDSQAAESPRSRVRTGRNGVLYRVQTRPGICIVAYAKTSRRMRLEVRHDLSELRHGYGLVSVVHGVEGMVGALGRVSEDAAEQLNAFLTHLERVTSDSLVPVSPSPTAFLFRVAELSESSGVAELIVRLLLTEGAVSRVDSLNNSISRLLRGGVLERAANAQGQQSVTFIPAPTYRRAVEYLRTLATPSDLTVRHRVRPSGASHS